jgi:serine protease AprX
MRYSIIGVTIEQVKQVGATGIKDARLTGIIFADLTGEMAVKLRSMGAEVEQVHQARLGVEPPVPVSAMPIYSLTQLLEITEMDRVRWVTSPPLLGAGANIAILDTGIRETHELIEDRVVYRENFTADPMGDRFDHGTGVASIAVKIAPLCNILNLKVLNDNGLGSEEDVVLAISRCIELHDTDPEIAPSTINLSLGTEDTGNPNESMRVAARAALNRGIWLACAAGNTGPGEGTVMSPATEPNARAIGSATISPFKVSEFSSRGPTREGIIKPDLLGFGENIIVASSKSDTATVAKSGTSFAAPFISGVNALLLEGIYRQVVISPELEAAFPTISDALAEWMDPASFEPLLPYLTVKPAGAPRYKDNHHGYGVPLGSLFVQAFTATTNIEAITGIVTPLIGLGMVGMMMGTMTRTLR